MAITTYIWPAQQVVVPPSASTGAVGSTAPTSATEGGGVGPDGNLHAISTDNYGNQNVNVISSALPAGAATATNQTAANSSLSAIQASTASTASNGATANNQATANSSLSTIASNTTGLATAANQTAANGSLSTIATNTTGLATASGQSTANSSLSTIATNTAATTSAVQAQGNDVQATGTLSASGSTIVTAALNGASEAAILVAGTWVGTIAVSGSLDGTTYANLETILSGGGNAWTNAGITANGAYKASGLAAYKYVKLSYSTYTSGSASVTINVSKATSVVAVRQSNGANLHATIDSSALPTGAATAANQATEISSLTTIATNTGNGATSANQTTGNSSLATIATNTTGVATAANQTTGNSSLATIASNGATSANQTAQTTANAAFAAKSASALITAPFDNIVLTYVASGNGAGLISTATYKLSTTTVNTLTLTYDSSNRITNVVKS